MGRITDTLQHAFNVFVDGPQPYSAPPSSQIGISSFGNRPHIPQYTLANERTIVASILATISVDVSDIELRHSMVDEEGGYVSTVPSKLQYCLAREANLDQAARAFRRDLAMMILDEGVAAVVPVRTTADPSLTTSFDVITMRVGKIVKWYAEHVMVRLYDDRTFEGSNGTAEFKEIVVPKKTTAIIENPFYTIMNEPNSTLQRLVKKLRLLDITDDKNSSGRLEMLIQLPYAVKSDVKAQEAEKRTQDIDFQLSTGKHGIAYIDGSEKVTQLNRPIENQLLSEITYLTDTAYSQLGITKGIMDGSADEATMINYMSRRVEPIVDAIAEEFQRKFLTKTAITQNQAVLYFRNPFKLIPITRLAEVSDVLSRNEIATPNDLRKAIGLPPSTDPKANQLNNSNMPSSSEPVEGATRFVSSQMVEDDAEAKLNSKMKELGV